MTQKNRHKSIKSVIRKEREGERRIATIITVSLVIVIITVSGFVVFQSINSPNQTVEPNIPKAAIVDQLILSIPNQTFIDASKKILEDAGYIVDYHKGEEVTVEFYRNLAMHSYKLIILRVHSALGPTGKPPLALFTSELYSTTKYLSEQLYDQVTKVGFNPEIYGDNKSYFGIMPDFVRYSMNGKFDGATIIMMGCDGIPNFWDVRYVGMAKAFVEKGAKVFISWSGPVLGSHSDAATIHLLRNLITRKQTVKEAVENTMMVVGSDPIYKSVMQYYPHEAENDVMQ
jgi:hypothetical protein